MSSSSAPTQPSKKRGPQAGKTKEKAKKAKNIEEEAELSLDSDLDLDSDIIGIGSSKVGTGSATPLFDQAKSTVIGELPLDELDDEEMDIYNMNEFGGDAANEQAIRERIQKSQETMRDILETFTPEQQQRYETFRRVGFPRPAIKKVINLLSAAFSTHF